VTTTQKQRFNRDNIVDNHLWLINDVKGETLKRIAIYLKNLRVPFGYLPNFINNPDLYPGNKITGLKDIVERFLDLSISKYYFEIQAERLPVKFVYDTIMKLIFQEG